MRTHGPLVLALVTAAACGADSSSAPPLLPDTSYTLEQAADSIPLRYGRTATVDGVYLTFARVVSDTRCPDDAHCVSEGDAEIVVQVDPPCYPECKVASAALHLHSSKVPRAGNYISYRVQLVGLHPLPLLSQKVDVSSYVAWVRISRLS